MNILICDDMQDITKELDGMLRASGFDVETTIFHNGYDVLDYIHTGAAVEICFLDIVMPEMSGVALAEQLREDGFTGEIILLSTSKEYGPESYIVKAFDYMLKPLTPDGVKSVLEKLDRARKCKDNKDILIKTTGIIKSVLLREISHLEVINHKVYFRLTNGSEIEVYAIFGEVARELLSDPRFVQCHRSYIVNMDDIAEIVENNIVMRNGARIPITRSYSAAKSVFYKRKLGGNKK